MIGNYLGSSRVHLYMGPMYSGKTDQMLRSFRRFKYLSNTISLLFKYSGDTRDGLYTIESRNGAIEQVTELISTGYEAWKCLQSAIKTADVNKTIIVVGIDEGQFISDLDYFVKKVLEQQMVIEVYISALDSTFQGVMWNEIIKIIPYCNGTVIKLSAICKICQKHEAQLTKRIIESDQLELIGHDQYVAACYMCFSNQVPI